MARIKYPKIVTANHLLEGDVIYMTASGDWSRQHEDAKLYEDIDDAEAALKIAKKQAHMLAGAYLADAQMDQNGIPVPVHFREAFRTRGPSNYLNHGKQAKG